MVEADKGSFGVKDKILLFKELWNLLRWGVGIADALALLEQNSENYATRIVMNTLREEIINGKNLSRSLKKFPKYFDETDIATIQSWEKSGNLDDILLMIGWEYSYIETLKKKFMGALTYPIILITVSIGAIFALFIFILPAIFEIADQFESSDLPFVTRILKDSSEYLAAHSLSLWGIVIFVFFAIFVFLSTKTGQIKLYQLLFQVPIIWKMMKAYYLVRFSRYTKMLIQSWVDYRVIFTMLKQVINHPIFLPLFDNIVDWLNRGKTIYDCIRWDTILIPNKVAALIKVGEQTATLPNTFDTIIAMYQEELDHYIENISKLIEPIMLVFVGGIVIMIALWVFWVILHIMDSVAV